jgi:hypothetical protein
MYSRNAANTATDTSELQGNLSANFAYSSCCLLLSHLYLLLLAAAQAASDYCQ